MNSIVFYNTYHSGDIHVSREFIKDIKSKLDIPMEYHHNNSNRLLLDVNVAYHPTGYHNYHYSNYQILGETDDILYVNTWYNPNFTGYQTYGCTLKALYENFKIVYNRLGIPLETLDFYIPSINFKDYLVHPIEQIIKPDPRKKIFISNGPCGSGQSHNFDFDYVINLLTTEFPQHLFIVGSQTNINKPNMIRSWEFINIIDTLGCDLNETSYLTTFCDVIVGRCSGPFTYALIKDNLISDKKQNWVGFCNIDPKFGIDEFIHPNKTFDWSNTSNADDAHNILFTIISQ